MYVASAIVFPLKRAHDTGKHNKIVSVMLQRSPYLPWVAALWYKGSSASLAVTILQNAMWHPRLVPLRAAVWSASFSLFVVKVCVPDQLFTKARVGPMIGRVSGAAVDIPDPSLPL
jgi:hypothetical protein